MDPPPELDPEDPPELPDPPELDPPELLEPQAATTNAAATMATMPWSLLARTERSLALLTVSGFSAQG
jgi:hypothetical protein